MLFVLDTVNEMSENVAQLDTVSTLLDVAASLQDQPTQGDMLRNFNNNINNGFV